MEEEVEMPAGLACLSAAEQQRLIKQRAAGLMALGTALIIAFSDPMVDAMSNVGQRVRRRLGLGLG